MNSILALARSEAGQITPNTGDTSLKDLLESIAPQAELQAQAKKLSFTSEILSGSDEIIHIDIEKTAQILNNLIHNAIKFTSSGSISLKASVNADTVEFSVADTGAGINSETAKHLFERFSAGQKPGTNNESGTGLGLWICKTFTEIQGGTIDVKSSVGQGTTFTVKLPRKQDSLQ
jgi:signal transduction histidine kinase